MNEEDVRFTYRFLGHEHETEFLRRVTDILARRKPRLEAALRHGVSGGRPGTLSPQSEEWIHTEALRLLSRDLESLGSEYLREQKLAARKAARPPADEATGGLDSSRG